MVYMCIKKNNSLTFVIWQFLSNCSWVWEQDLLRTLAQPVSSAALSLSLFLSLSISYTLTLSLFPSSVSF